MTDPRGRGDIRILGRVTEAEVIATFLRAELESQRWREHLLRHLDADGRDTKVVDEPDVRDPEQNAYRELLLERHRSWLSREGLFNGFPHNVEWSRAALSREQVLEILYIDWDWWLRISSETRLPLEAARRIRDGEIAGSTAEWHRPIAARIQSDSPPPELIVVASPTLAKLVLLEGHVRLTAYALFPEYLPESLEIFLGVSEELERWTNF